MSVPETCSGRPRQPDAGGFQPEISSFRLHMAADGRAAKTVRTYTEAVRWFAAVYLGRRGTAHAGKRSGSGPPGPDGRAETAPRPGETRPGFTGDELPRPERACAGRGFPERSHAAIIAVLEATGISRPGRIVAGVSSRTQKQGSVH